MAKKLRNIYVGLMGKGDKARSIRKALLAFGIRLGSAAFVYFSHIILARWLGDEGFGIYTYVWTWVVILGSFSTLGFSTLMVKEVPTYFKRGKFGKYLGLMFFGRMFSLALSLVITISGLLLVYALGDMATNPFILPLLLAITCVPLFALVDVQEGMCRANDWIYTGLIPNYLMRPMVVLIVSAGYMYFGQEVDATVVVIGCIIGSFVSVFSQIIVIEMKIRRKVGAVTDGVSPTKEVDWKPWLLLALPLLLTDSFLLIMANTDIVILQYFMQPEDIGVYYAAVKTTLLVAFIYFAVVLASSNKFAEHWHDDNHEKLTIAINHSVRMTFIPSFFASIGIIATGYWFLAAYGENFTRGYSVILILSFGAILKAATGPTEWMMTMMGQQRLVLISLGAASIVNIILNIVLIPIWGLAGAAAATAFSSAGSAIFLFLKVKRELKIPIKFAGFI